MKFNGMLFAAQLHAKLAIAPVPLKIIAKKMIVESEIKILALNSVKSQFIVGNTGNTIEKNCGTVARFTFHSE